MLDRSRLWYSNTASRIVRRDAAAVWGVWSAIIVDDGSPVSRFAAGMSTGKTLRKCTMSGSSPRRIGLPGASLRRSGRQASAPSGRARATRSRAGSRTRTDACLPRPMAATPRAGRSGVPRRRRSGSGYARRARAPANALSASRGQSLEPVVFLTGSSRQAPLFWGYAAKVVDFFGARGGRTCAYHAGSGWRVRGSVTGWGRTCGDERQRRVARTV